jgi:Mg-chelatase subunit ChlD
MYDEKKTGIQISRQSSNKEISIVGGAIKIAASEEPITSSFVVNWGRIFMILDCSRSMKGKKLEQARQGIVDFAKDALKKEYKVGIIKFSDRAEHLCESTGDIEILKNSIKDLRASGGTNLTAAIKIAHEKLKDFSNSTRVMVVATDGMPDNVKSSLVAANAARDEGIEIITIGSDDADKEFLKMLASRSELSTKVSSDMFAQAITNASLLLMSPKRTIPK